MKTSNPHGVNSIVTPHFIDAYKLHRLLFQRFYQYPFDIELNKHKISVKLNNVLQLKYIPFLIALIVITTMIGFSTCAFLPMFKLFKRSSHIDPIAVVICVFLGSCSLLEWATYLVCCKSTEIEPLINQLFAIERKCKKYKLHTFLKFIRHLNN